MLQSVTHRYENLSHKQSVLLFGPCYNVKETVHGHVLVRNRNYFKMAAKVSLIRWKNLNRIVAMNKLQLTKMILKHCQFYNAFNQMKKSRLSSVTNLTTESHIDTDYIITLIWYTLHIKAFHTVPWSPHSCSSSCFSTCYNNGISIWSSLLNDGHVYGRISQYCTRYTILYAAYIQIWS